MSLKTLVVILGSLSFVLFMRIPTYGQRMTQTPFKYAQLGFLDSTIEMSVTTGFLYPAVLLALKSTTVLSVGKMLEVPNWNQITGGFISKKKNTGVGFHFSLEKVASSAQLRTSIQLARALQHGLDIGLVMGLSSGTAHGYRRELQPFSKLGLQTKLSAILTSSFTLILESQSGFLLKRNKSIYTSLLTGTQLQISGKVAVVLHLQKTVNYPMEWVGLLSYSPGEKFLFQLGFSPDPQWWMLRTSFVLNQFTMQLGLGVHPLVGALSQLSFQIPSATK
jgi:hypothetical protein